MDDLEEKMLIKKSIVKDVVHAHHIHIGEDALEALSDKVLELLAEATQRAGANHRKTILAQDI